MVGRLDGGRLFAPPLLAFELANVCVTKSRRFPAKRAAIMSALLLRARLDVQEVQIDHDAVTTLALQSGLTAYDASYLWLARELGAELVTLDAQLSRAVLALGQS